MAAARVYYNGALLTEHLGGYTPFSCELTGRVTGGDDTLAVVVDSHERDDIPPFGFVIDYLTYGGIYREVWLEETGNVCLQNARVKPRRSTDCWIVETDAYVDNAIGASGKAGLRLTMRTSGGETQTETFDVLLTGERRQTLAVSFQAEQVRLWDLDEPNLYEMKLELLRDGAAPDEIVRRFGFREAASLIYPGLPAAYFQVLELAAAEPRGTVAFHPAFAARDD